MASSPESLIEAVLAEVEAVEVAGADGCGEGHLELDSVGGPHECRGDHCQPVPHSTEAVHHRPLPVEHHVRRDHLQRRIAVQPEPVRVVHLQVHPHHA